MELWIRIRPSYVCSSLPPLSTTGFFWTFFRLLRIVDLPEIWGFWRFYLEFWVNSWVFDKFCLILDKNSYIWLKIFLNFWKFCRKFEFLAKNSWLLSFLSLSLSFFHLEFLIECPKKNPGLDSRKNKSPGNHSKCTILCWFPRSNNSFMPSAVRPWTTDSPSHPPSSHPRI